MKRLLLTVALLAPAAAHAQQFTSDLETRRVGDDAKLNDRLSVFIFGAAATSEYDAKFDVASKSASQEAKLIFNATNMETQILTPQVGMSYAVSPRALVHASLGTAAISMTERLVEIPGTAYGNQHDLIFKSDLRPGLAFTLGTMFNLTRFGDFTVNGGVRLSYTSSSRLKEESVTGDITIKTNNSPTGTIHIDEINTEDVTLRMLALRGNLGLEWRPIYTLLSNHFGLTLGYGYTGGSITRAIKVNHTINGTLQENEETNTVGVRLLPSYPVGVYYGWTIFLKRFGSIGLEVQALNAMQGSVQYQYIF